MVAVVSLSTPNAMFISIHSPKWYYCKHCFIEVKGREEIRKNGPVQAKDSVADKLALGTLKFRLSHRMNLMEAA